MIDHNALLVGTKEVVVLEKEVSVQVMVLIDHDQIVQVMVLLVQREPEATKEVVHASNDEPKRVVTVVKDQDKTTNTAQPDSNSMLLVLTKSHVNPTVIVQNAHLTVQPAATRKNPTPHHVPATMPEDVVTSDGHVRMGRKISYNYLYYAPHFPYRHLFLNGMPDT